MDLGRLRGQEAAEEAGPTRKVRAVDRSKNKLFAMFEAVLSFAETANFIGFIFGSKYPTLVHRFARVDFVGWPDRRNPSKPTSCAGSTTSS